MTTLKSDEKLVDIRSLALVLEYLYTGSVPFGDVTPAEVISLIAHCELYHIDRLRWLCERYLQAVMNDDLFFTLLLVSDISGVSRAKKICMQYGSTHFEKLIVKKENVGTLGIELFREFVVFSTIQSEILEDLSQLSFPNTIRDEFKIIYTAMANPDAFFSFKSANTTIPCHRAILFAQSDKFKALLLDETNQVPSEGRYTLPKDVAMSADAFKSFLAWAYYRDTSFSAAHAAMMLPLAIDFEITALSDECDAKLRKGIAVQSVIPILSLCFSEYGKKSYKKELLQPCLDFLVLNFANVDLGAISNSAINAVIAGAIRDAVIDGRWKQIDGSHENGPSPKNSRHSIHHTNTDSESKNESEIANSASAPDDKKNRKKKNRRTAEIEVSAISAATLNEDLADSTSTPKTSRKIKAMLGSSSEIVSPAASASLESNTEEAPKKEEKEETPKVESLKAAEAPAKVEETPSKVEEAPVKTEEAPAKTEEAPEKAVEPPVAEEKNAKKQEAEKVEASPVPEPAPVESALPATETPAATATQSKQETKSSPKAERTEKAAESESKPLKRQASTKSTKSGTSKGSTSPKATPDLATASVRKEEEPITSPSTLEKRATMVPSTSVKAIKESFDAKIEKAEKEAAATANTRAARRKSQNADSPDIKHFSEASKKSK